MYNQVMNSSFSKIVVVALGLAMLLLAGSAWAHPGPAHIHEGPGMVMHHDNHSPFDKPGTAGASFSQKDAGSLHCALAGHDPSQPCPHMQSHTSRQDGMVRIGMECGGHSGPDGQSLVKTGASIYGVVSTSSGTPCTGQELFPSIHPMLSRSLDATAPPPRRAHSH